MKTLQQIKNELENLRESVISLSISYQILPQTMCQIDCENLLDEIKYLNGYIDCMEEFKIDLLSETP